MRTIGFRSNVLFALVAAAGVVASLGRPWYAPPRAADTTPVEDLFGGIARAFGETEGTTGWEALRTADELLAGLAGLTALLLLLTLVPALQPHVRLLARWSALGAVGVVLIRLVDAPPGMGEPRQGLLIALGCSLILVACTAAVAAAPSRRRAPIPTYTPPQF